MMYSIMITNKNCNITISRLNNPPASKIKSLNKRIAKIIHAIKSDPTSTFVVIPFRCRIALNKYLSSCSMFFIIIIPYFSFVVYYFGFPEIIYFYYFFLPTFRTLAWSICVIIYCVYFITESLEVMKSKKACNFVHNVYDIV